MEEDNFCRVIHVSPNDRKDLSRAISDVCNILGAAADVNLNRDEPLVVALYQRNKCENSLGYLFPDLAKEFHTSKNASLRADDINKRSSRKVWWECSVCHHEWMASVASRTNGSGCPACAGRVLVQGKNDLEAWCKETGNEDVLAEWDYVANNQRPCDTTKRSPYMATWKCGKCGASYQSRVYNRTNGCGCPVCSGKKTKSGINDFQTWCVNNGREHLLSEWATENELSPSQVSHGSGKRILWTCSVCSHHWLATVDNRKKGKGCPKCGNLKRALSNRTRVKGHHESDEP